MRIFGEQRRVLKRAGAASTLPRFPWRAHGSMATALLIGLALCSYRVAPALAHTVQGKTLRSGPMRILSDTPSHLDLGAGVYDIIGNAHRNETAAVDAEYRFGSKLYHIGPAVGVIADMRGGGMVYGGFYGDIAFGRVIITPLAGLGAWWHGGRTDEDLGGTFQFRLSLEVAYRLDDRSRLGVRFGHISSADIHKVNPGENDLMLIYAFPLKW